MAALRMLAALALLGCTSAPQVAGPARADHAAALRSCATVTQHCPGVAALVARMPGSCRTAPAACLVSVPSAAGRETLGALDLPGGDVCGYRRVDGAGQLAILGRISRSVDGTVQYASARFPKDGAGLARIDTVAQLAAACAALN